MQADSRFASSQWETSFGSNTASHWLSANPELAPQCIGQHTPFVSICHTVEASISGIRVVKLSVRPDFAKNGLLSIVFVPSYPAIYASHPSRILVHQMINPLAKKLTMASSSRNIFSVTGHLCGEFTGHRWIPHTKASDAELWCFLWSAPE